jgi:hypothetical protein
MALEIIGAGFGRTGTYSLRMALKRLGYGPCHHMSEVIGDPRQIRLWSEAADGKPNFDALFTGFRSAVDFPIAAFWQDALAAYPDAKVILSDRDPDDWYESFSQTILPLILDRSAWPENARPWFQMLEKVVIGRAFGGRTDRENILAAYRANQDATRALDKSGKALIFNARQGWAPLCRFLGVAVPDEPYPKSNPRAEFFAAVKSGTAEPAA